MRQNKVTSNKASKTQPTQLQDKTYQEQERDVYLDF